VAFLENLHFDTPGKSLTLDIISKYPPVMVGLVDLRLA
jgi:hypothetical protein